MLQTAIDYGDLFSEDAAEGIRKNFYVDNLLKAFDDKVQCERFMCEMSESCVHWEDGG